MPLELRAMAEKNAATAQNLEAFAGISLVSVRDKISRALSHIGQFGLFEEYTKHDIAHVDAMLDTYDWLIPAETQEAMTSAEWLMLTLGTYLHDFGMLVTRDEFDKRNETGFPSFVTRLSASVNLDDRDYESHLDSLDAETRERFLYQEFVRTNHAARIRSWLTDAPDPSLGFDERVCKLLREILTPLEPTFIDDLGMICESHHRNDLDDVTRYVTDKPYGRTPSEAANLQYIAILLRAADLLHITRDRTPSVAFRIINPKNPISLLEWEKQQKVRTVRPQRVVSSDLEAGPSTSSDTIEVHATFTEGKAFFGLTSYLQYAAQELKRCSGWARESASKAGVRHLFPWTRIDSSHVAAKGFVATQFEFRLDQHKVLDLLTGHTLYNDTSVVVRELVQNSIDAVRLQRLVSSSPSYRPTVLVTWNDEDRTIRVIDNGTGMTEATIKENFLHVGASKYQSEDFKRQHPTFSSISRFGIGVLSAFMISDDVRVLTSHPDEVKAREISLESVHGQYLMRVLPKASSEIPPEIRDHGTAIEVRVRETAQLKDLGELLRYWIVVPGCDVYFEAGGKREKVGFDTAKDALEAKVQEASGRDRLGNNYEVRSATYPGLEIAYVVEWSRWFREYSLVGHPGRDAHYYDAESFEIVTSERTSPAAPLSGMLIEGIRVTERSPAMASGGIWALANATGLGAPRTNVARTALERGNEFDTFTASVFRAYVDHVTAEVTQMHQSRGLSLTRAVFEVPFIAGALWDSRNSQPEDYAALVAAQTQLPVYVLEDRDGRRAASLQELSNFDEFVTVDNEMIEGVDSLLSSLPRSVTMRQMFDAIGDNSITLPSAPILRLGRSNYFSRLLRARFEVREVKAASHSDLACVWRQTDRSKPSWISDYDARGTQVFSGRGLVRELQFSGTVWAPMTDVPFVGPDDISLVRITGDLHLLSDHPALRVKTTSDDVPLWMRRWFGCILVGAYLSRETGYRNHDRMNPSDRISFVMSGVQKSGLLNHFDEGSVASTLESMPTQILDPRYSWRGYEKS